MKHHIFLLSLLFTFSLLPAEKENDIELMNFTKKSKPSLMEQVKKQSIPKDFSYNIPINDVSLIKLCDICPDKHLAATYHDDGHVKIWDLTSGKCKNLLTMNSNITAIAFHPYGSKIVIADYKDTQPKMDIWNLNDNTIFASYKFNANIPIGINCLVCLNSCENKQVFMVSAYVNHEDVLKRIYQYNVEEKKISLMGYFDAQIFLNTIIKKKPYKSDISCFPTNSLMISKTHCDSFYYCQQAVKLLADSKKSREITSSDEYKLLTEYEKKVIDDAIAKKIKPTNNIPVFPGFGFSPWK